MSKILAIDDKPDNLESIKALLNHLMPACTVITCESGEKGIEMAVNEQPDTIILDVIMPEMDGYEVCTKLKSNPATSHIPVLMLTAIKTDTPSRIKGLQHGADAFFSKPIDPYELSAQVSVLLRVKKTEDSLKKEKKALIDNVDEKTRDLLENEIKLNQIVNGYSIPAFVIDNDHKITHWNKALENLSGLKAANMIGSTDHWQFIHKSKFPLLADLIIDRIDLKTASEKFGIHCKASNQLPDAIESEKELINIFDQEKFYFCNAVPIRNDNGDIICALETVQDITQRRKDEIELKKHREKLEELVQERTKELELKNEELNQMNRLFTGREFRIKELRDIVSELKKEIEYLKKN